MLAYSIFVEIDDDLKTEISYYSDKPEEIRLASGKILTSDEITRMIELGLADRLKLFVEGGNWSI